MGVYVLVDTPAHNRTIQEGQPPTTIAAYYLPVAEDQSVSEVVAAHASTLPLGSAIKLVDEDDVQHFELSVSLEPAVAAPPPSDAAPAPRDPTIATA